MKSHTRSQFLRKAATVLILAGSFFTAHCQIDTTITLSPEATELLGSINAEITQHQNKRLEVSSNPTLDSAAQSTFWYQSIDKIIEELELKRDAILNGDY